MIFNHYAWILALSIAFLIALAVIVKNFPIKMVCVTIIFFDLLFLLLFKFSDQSKRSEIVRVGWSVYIILFVGLLYSKVQFLDETHIIEELDKLDPVLRPELETQIRRFYLEGFIVGIGLNAIGALNLSWVSELCINIFMNAIIAARFSSQEYLVPLLSFIVAGNSVLTILKHQKEFQQKYFFVLKIIKQQKLRWFKFIVQDQASNSMILMKVQIRKSVTSAQKPYYPQILMTNKKFCELVRYAPAGGPLQG